MKATGRVIMPLGNARPVSPIKQSHEELHQVACPYCALGIALVHVHKQGDTMQVDMNQTPQCGTCQKYFKLRTRVVTVGMPLEEHLQHGYERKPREIGVTTSASAG